MHDYRHGPEVMEAYNGQANSFSTSSTEFFQNQLINLATNARFFTRHIINNWREQLKHKSINTISVLTELR